MEKDDKELLKEFRQPDLREKAFTDIVRKYQEKLYWHIRRIVIGHEDANDIMQNVFLKVWNNLDNFKENSQLYTWLYKIATNECLTFLEQQKKRKVIWIDDENSDLENKILAQPNFDSANPEWKLQLAIQKLPEKQRIVFNLRYFDEMPYEAMSQILGTSQGALKANYHHAAKKVEDFLRNN